MKSAPGTRIAPAALADRWLGGDSIAALAADFELSAEVVEAAIRQWADERTRAVVDMTPGGVSPYAVRRYTTLAEQAEPAWMRELERLRLKVCDTDEIDLRHALLPLAELRRVILSGKGEAVIPEGMTKFMPIEGGGYYPAGLWEPCGVYADWRRVDQENGIYTADKAWLLLAIDSYANSLINP